MNLIRLEDLPVPISPNRRKSNHFAMQRQKDDYRRAVWVAAIAQHRPYRDPPEYVSVWATLYLCRLRDEDNATASIKWTLDALRQVQQGACKWRWHKGAGLYQECGYFVDDDPVRLTLSVDQQRVRKKKEERLVVEIRDVSDRLNRVSSLGGAA